MYAQHSSSGTFTLLYLIISKIEDLMKKVLNVKCVFQSSLQHWCGMLFTVIHIQQIIFKMHMKMHVDLLAKCLLLLHSFNKN